MQYYQYLVSTPVGGFWRYCQQSLELGTLIERYFDEQNKVHEVGILTKKELVHSDTAGNITKMNEIAPLDLVPYKLTMLIDHTVGRAATYTLKDGTEFHIYWLDTDIRCHFVDSAKTAIAHIHNIVGERFWAKADKEFG